MAKYSWVNKGNALLLAFVMISSLAASLFNPTISKAAVSWDADYWNLGAPSSYPVIPEVASDLSRTDTDIVFDWSTGSPDPSIDSDGFVARWVADQTFETGYYNFEITADDGFKVYVDNEIIMSKWMDAAGTYQSTRYISAGTHEVKVEYYENVTNASITFEYSKVTLAEHEDAIQIYDCEDLQAMNDDLTANYQLANNIDCSATSTWNSGDGFLPIGTGSTFTGTLDGNNKIVSNLNINSGSSLVGLFSTLGENSVVRDLYIANANVAGYGYVGILAGNLSNGTASNVRTSGAVTATDDYAGGLVGSHFAGVGYTIMDCVSSADVTGVGNVGGLVGENTTGSISRSSALGDIVAAYSAGGLVGSALNTTIEYSYAKGNVVVLDGGDTTGGLVGYSNFGVISRSFATGNVGSDGSEFGIEGIGGLIGSARDTVISNVFAEGDVTGGNDQAGGLVGYFSTNSTAVVNLSNAYSTGNIATDIENSTNVGGLVGYANDAQISDVYSSGNVSVNTVNTSQGSIGGLIGSMAGANTLLSNASSEGDVTVLSASSAGGIGGLIGFLGTQSTSRASVSSTYSTGDVSSSADDSYTGALIGQINSLGDVDRIFEVNNSYATGSVTGYNAISGLVGNIVADEDDSITILNTFSTGAIVPSDEFTDSSGVAGAYSINFGTIEEINTFWDSETSGMTYEEPYYGVGAKTTVEMKNIRTFTDLAFNAGLQNAPVFDFTDTQYDDVGSEDVWAIDGFGNSGYPFLSFDQNFDFSSFTNLDADPETDTTEFESINNGDTNDDDIFDDEQRNVTAFNNSVSDNVSVLEVSSECFVISTDASGESTLGSQDSGHSYPAGLVSFMVECDAVGSTVTITQYFHGLDNANLVARKFDPNTSGYSTINGATITKTTIGGQTVTKVSYQITDGGELDEDGVANGVIVDPSGPGYNNVGAPNTGLKKLIN